MTEKNANIKAWLKYATEYIRNIGTVVGIIKNRIIY